MIEFSDDDGDRMEMCRFPSITEQMNIFKHYDDKAGDLSVAGRWIPGSIPTGALLLFTLLFHDMIYTFNCVYDILG